MRYPGHDDLYAAADRLAAYYALDRAPYDHPLPSDAVEGAYLALEHVGYDWPRGDVGYVALMGATVGATRYHDDGPATLDRDAWVGAVLSLSGTRAIETA